MSPANNPAHRQYNSRPIFIVGYMHSGTTLLRKVLGRHPAVFSIRAETMFFDQLAHTFPRRFSNLHDDAAFEAYIRFLIKKTTFDWPPVTAAEAELEAQQFQPDETLIGQILNDARQQRDYIATFRHVYTAIATAAGKSHWIEKTPSHIFHVDEIVAGLPGTRIIELVRDPRDVLASKKVRKHSDWSARYGQAVGSKMQITKGYDPLRDSLGWRAAVRAGAKASNRYPDCFLRLRYEDLATEPVATVHRLCEFLDLEFDSGMLEVGWSNSTARAGTNAAMGIDRSAVGKWRGILTPDVTSLCQQINGREMTDLGYEQMEATLGNQIKAPYWVARSGVDLIAHYYELWQSRGLEYVQGMVRNTWHRAGHLAKR